MNKKRLIIISTIAAIILITITIVSLTANNQQPGNQQSTTNDNSNVDSTLDNQNVEYGTIQSQQIIYDDLSNWSKSIINNYDSIVTNLPPERANEASKMLLYTLSYNNISQIPTDITIRDGSYQQSLEQSTMTYETTYIVDVPSIQQSYRIKDRYSAIDANNIDSYTTVVTCLNTDEMIYPSFNCLDQIKQEKGL